MANDKIYCQKCRMNGSGTAQCCHSFQRMKSPREVNDIVRGRITINVPSSRRGGGGVGGGGFGEKGNAGPYWIYWSVHHSLKDVHLKQTPALENGHVVGEITVS